MTRIKPSNIWTHDQDVELLRLRAQGRTFPQLAVHFDRTEASCSARVRVLLGKNGGKRKRPVGPPPVFWR